MDKGKRFVIGDIHGCVLTFRKMVEEHLQLTKNDTLFLLGDYIDRGPDPKGVVDYIIELQRNSYNVVPILGNHEYMLLQSMENDEDFENWTQNGYLTTLLSFGIKLPDIKGRSSVFDIHVRYIDFFKGLVKFAETKGFLLVHAGIGRDKENPFDLYSLLWTREEFHNNKALKGRKLIHGHTPMSLNSIRDRVYDPEEEFLNLDGGCVYKQFKGFGNLVALNLETMDLFVQENID